MSLRVGLLVCGVVALIATAGAQEPILRIRLKRPVASVYQIRISATLDLSTEMRKQLAGQSVPDDGRGAFTVAGTLQRTTKPDKVGRFSVADQFTLKEVTCSGMVKGQEAEIRKQAIAPQRQVTIDAMGKMISVEKDDAGYLSPLYAPFPSRSARSWTENRKADGRMVPIRYRLLPGAGGKTFRIGQAFTAAGMVSEPGAWTEFDARNGLPTQGQLRYAQNTSGVIVRIRYEVWSGR